MELKKGDKYWYVFPREGSIPLHVFYMESTKDITSKLGISTTWKIIYDIPKEGQEGQIIGATQLAGTTFKALDHWITRDQHVVIKRILGEFYEI